MACDQGPGSGVRISHNYMPVRYPHPKFLPSGKGLTIALAGSSYFINVDDNAEDYHSGGCRQYGDRP